MKSEEKRRVRDEIRREKKSKGWNQGKRHE